MAVEHRTSTVTINAAFLQEIKEVNEELWKLLEDVRNLCREPQQVAGDRRQVVDKLADLRDQLALHFALEEAFGYFEDPVRVAPRLSVAAGNLRAEHQLLYSRIRDLADEVDEDHRSGKLATTAPRVVEQFLAYYDLLQQHEMRENELILEAYDSDIGVGD
jgi:hemerythrin-like domain-containing protein